MDGYTTSFYIQIRMPITEMLLGLDDRQIWQPNQAMKLD